MARKIIPNGEPIHHRNELQALASGVGMAATDIGMACELLEDAFCCMGGDRLQRGQVAMLIYAIASKAADIEAMADDMRAQEEAAHA